MNTFVIYTGGQTGVDEGAIEAVIEFFHEKLHQSYINKTKYEYIFKVSNTLSIILSGFCPKNRTCETGRISPSYPMFEVESDDYKFRTALNVRFTKGLLVFSRDKQDEGTIEAIRVAKIMRREILEVHFSDDNLLDNILNWIKDKNIYSVNIAGPRESKCEGITSQTKYIIKKLIKKLYNNLLNNNNFIKYPNVNTLYVLGPLGSFSYELATKICEALNIKPSFISISTLDELYEISRLKDNDSIVLIPKTDKYKNSKEHLTITFNTPYYLLSSGSICDIEAIHSHPVALKSCKVWLETNFPRAKLVEESSTSAAAAEATFSPTRASISSRTCAEIYGLEILQE
ncbi:3612_t:CDS:1, partial [Gigaspora margarita]